MFALVVTMLSAVVWTCGPHPVSAEDTATEDTATDDKATDDKATDDKETDDKATDDKRAAKKRSSKAPLTAAEREALRAQAKIKKLRDLFHRRLGKLKPSDAGKKSKHDYYLTCTVEINPVLQRADLRFELKQGQAPMADFLTDFVLNPPENTLRNWHVIARFIDPTQADLALQEVRERYDEMVAYRTQLQRQYNVKQTRRC